MKRYHHRRAAAPLFRLVAFVLALSLVAPVFALGADERANPVTVSGLLASISGSLSGVNSYLSSWTITALKYATAPGSEIEKNVESQTSRIIAPIPSLGCTSTALDCPASAVDGVSNAISRNNVAPEVAAVASGSSSSALKTKDEVFTPTTIAATAGNASVSAASLTAAAMTRFDFDGDGKADIAVFRPSMGTWFILQSSNGAIVSWQIGQAGDIPVPADYDGDGKTDPAVFRPSNGVWYMLQSSTNLTTSVQWGAAGDIPVAADYDGDHKADLGVFRPSSGVWYVSRTTDGGMTAIQFGAGSDIPAVGDYDGDGKADICVWRPSNGVWYMLSSSSNFTGLSSVSWGMAGDIPVPADYDGDGKTDYAIWRPSTGEWVGLNSGSGNQTMMYVVFGSGASQYGDVPVPADYDGDGKDDIAVWRHANGYWYILQSRYNNTMTSASFGASEDLPAESSHLNIPNQAPVANPGAAYTAAPGTAIRLDGSASYDPDGAVASYSWNFGDNTTGTGARPSHVYSAPGNFTVTLTVTDNRGMQSAAAQATVNVINVDAVAARVDPFNQTGGGGENPVSRNFNWTTDLVALPGRAGMNAGIGLSYNSLVWFREGNALVFDADNGFPSPGFRLGMPVIQKKTYSPSRGKNVYLMVASSGAKIEFRQIGSTNVYETADSSFAQLTENGSNLTVKTTGGDQQAYQLFGNEFQCAGVEDANGNLVSLSYNANGRLAQMTDTLGRQLQVIYDANGNPLQIVQNYQSNGQTLQRSYATFGYSQISLSTAFGGGVSIIGPGNGTSVTVLSQVGYGDGSYTKFAYNSYGQVYQLTNYAADSSPANDNHELNHLKYTFDLSSGQTDCPRFTARDAAAENWMTVSTAFAAPVSQSWTPPDTNTADSGAMSKVTTPDGTEQRLFYHSQSSAAWDRGIPVYTETWSGGALQRWTHAAVAQDNTTLSYQENPRVTANAVGDGTNTRKSSTTYGATITLPNSGTTMRLPSDEFEYNSDGSVYRHRQTAYLQPSGQYASNYIVGLASETRLYAGSGTNSLMARTGYTYDGENLTGLSRVIQHDVSYDTTMTARGNLTATTSYSVNSSDSTVNRAGYNIAGATAWTQSPIQTSTSRVSISYTDSFADRPGASTYAYPTTVTDAAGYTATAKYNYVSGLLAETQGAQPGQTSNSVRGVIRQILYETGTDRILTVQTLNSDRSPTGAYTRYEYPTSQTLVRNFTQLDSTLGEVFSFNVLDGAGRTRATGTELPGSTLKYSGQKFEYDNMGRRWKSSLPAETDAGNITVSLPTTDPTSWSVTGGDDATAGWLYTTQTFDWKGRPLVTTNTDGSTKTASYQGCGCAGGEVVTVQGEQLAAGKRTQMIYADVFGRQYKTQILNWDGTPYTTTVQTLNARDQATQIRQYAGNDSSTTYQDVTMGYDGYGRLLTRHIPEQDPNAATTYAYYSDDRVQSITDGRGAVQNYQYEGRGLLQGITYTIPTDPLLLYPFISIVNNRQDLGSNFLEVDGGKFSSDVAVIASVQQTVNGVTSLNELSRYTGAQLTRQPVNGGEALTFQITDQATINAFNSGNLYLQAINVGSGKATDGIPLSRAGSNLPNYWYGIGDIHAIAQTPAVTYGYDAVGNRTSMSDGVGQVSYAYDQLSHLQSENRHFNNITNASSTDGNYKLSYEYTASGALTSITDPFNAKISYALDKTGRTSTVTGAVAYAGMTNYATELQYRAWGAAKHFKYGDGSTLDVSYDGRLNPSQYQLKNTSATTVMAAQYTYYADGRLQFVNDTMNHKFDRKYSYDQVGRITSAVTGYQANGQTYNPDGSNTGPYGLTFGYDAFDNLNSRTNQYWYSSVQPSFATSYTNNRDRRLNWIYDGDGRLINSQITNYNNGQPSVSNTAYSFDAAGRFAPQSYNYTSGNYMYGLDGDGQQVKSTDNQRYYVRSSVMGGAVISEVSSEWGQPSNHAGLKMSTYVYLAGQVIAEQTTTGIYNVNPSQVIAWKQKDPLGTSVYFNGKQAAIDPNGISTDSPNYSNLQQYPSYYSQVYNSYSYSYGNYDPWQGTGTHGDSGSPYGYGGGVGGAPGNPSSGCTINGSPVSCDEAIRGLNNDSLSLDIRNFFRFESGGRQYLDLPFNSSISIFGVEGLDGHSGFYGLFLGGQQTRNQTVNSNVSTPKDDISDSCKKDLEDAGKTIDGLNRAKESLAHIEKLLGGKTAFARLLAAIGVQETDFLNIPQFEGGPGRGVYQIEPKTYGISEQDAMDFDKATIAVGNYLVDNFLDIAHAAKAEGFVSSDRRFQLFAGLARIHNRGRGGVVSVNGKGNANLGSLIKLGLASGDWDFPELDNAGRKFNKNLKETANGTYVKNVIHIFYDCFNGFVGIK